jgi:hypothetical protein
MKTLLIFAHFLLISQFALSQKIENQNWQDEITSFGFTESQDSIKIGAEVMKLMQDSTYRKEAYPLVYTWLEAIDLLEKNQVKRAFWRFINLYAGTNEDKNTVVQAILKYDEIIDMEKALAASFYTYSFLDPEVVAISHQKRELIKPDRLELKFQNMTELVNIVVSARSQKIVSK